MLNRADIGHVNSEYCQNWTFKSDFKPLLTFNRQFGGFFETVL